MSVSAQALTARAESLRSEVKWHKSAIRLHREQLGVAKTALEAVEQECRRYGIGFRVETGDVHGTTGARRSGSHT